jgi:predicted TIM-barrel fold metal-dependent hydrolase
MILIQVDPVIEIHPHQPYPGRVHWTLAAPTEQVFLDAIEEALSLKLLSSSDFPYFSAQVTDLGDLFIVEDVGDVVLIR